MGEGRPGLWDPAHRRTTAGLLTLVTLIAFEAMAVGTAMPTAVTDLDGLAWYAWPFSAYLVASVVGMVLGGEAGDRRGPRVALPLGVGTFAVGLLLAGVASSMGLLVVGRAVQGLGAGVMATMLYVIAGQVYEGSLRPRLFGAISAAWVLPALVGPVIAGVVTTTTSWRLVFLGLLPFVAVGLLLIVSASRLPAADGADRAGGSRAGWALLAGLGIVCLQYAGQRLDLLALAIAAVGLLALVAGLRPLLPRGTALARPGLPAVVASRGLLAGAFFGMDALLPLTLTAVHGYSPTAAGLPLTAGAIGWATASQLQARRPDVPRERILRLGFVILAVGLAGTALAALPALGGWPAYLSWAVAGLGMGLGIPSVGILLLDRSSGRARGANSAALQISDVTASALCIGLAGVLIAAATAGTLSLSAAVVLTVVVLTALALVGVRVAGRAAAPVPRGDRADATTLAAP